MRGGRKQCTEREVGVRCMSMKTINSTIPHKLQTGMNHFPLSISVSNLAKRRTSDHDVIGSCPSLMCC